MLVDFLCGTGIPKAAFFCSSLPGNDIKEQIAGEVKDALKHSLINIVILSQDYYQSAYCLNEAGVLWYQDTPVIPVALPEIDSNNMYGFLSNEYKLRRLNVDTDIAYIYDSVREATSTAQISSAIIICENNKLREKYTEYLNKRTISPERNSTTPSIAEITTDDERIVLFYLLHNTVRKATKAAIIQWLNENEIHSVNVDNAFDLLSSFHGSKLSDDTLELDIGVFRKYTSSAGEILPELKDCVERHILLSANTFGEKWNTGAFDSIIKLFTAYIIDEKVSHFGARWMTEGQIESIRAWENKNKLDSTLSENYSSCIELFIHDKFVYESDWTSYGNPKEYALYPSLKKLLFDCPQPLLECIERIKQEYKFELPF